jgi:hypothetical protein
MCDVVSWASPWIAEDRSGEKMIIIGQHEGCGVIIFPNMEHVIYGTAHCTRCKACFGATHADDPEFLTWAAVRMAVRSSAQASAPPTPSD